jgi:hypothetical protein
VGATFTGLATVLLFAAPAVGVPVPRLAGYGIAGVVALLAGAAGVLDYCVGCEMYRQVGYVQRAPAADKAAPRPQSLPPPTSSFETNCPRSPRRSATSR